MNLEGRIVAMENGLCGSRREQRAGLRWQGRPPARIASAAAASSSGSREESSRQPTPAANRGQRRVLLVDDSPAYRRALRMVIETLGDIEVLEAQSGEEALEILPEARPQLVLMDINLPGINGIETTARVLEIAPTTVVVGLSIQTDAQTREAILKVGASTLLNKESGIATVLAIVECHL
jgi:CheY-like chemotaxis protein